MIFVNKEQLVNPDTNKFEMLKETEETKQLEKVFREASNQLVRPNGEPVPKHWTQFQVGEHVVIKNYTFTVAYIGESVILFEPLGIVEVK